MLAPFRSRIVGAIVLALSSACGRLMVQPLPPGAERFVPPAAYARWWALTEECSGVARPFQDVHFYRVPGVDSIPAGSGHSAVGYWESKRDRIVLAGRWTGEGRVVRHEMLHALVRGRGHSPAYFQGRCAGVVGCNAVGCQDDGRPPADAPANAPTLPLSALVMHVEAVPSRVSRQGADREFSVVVRVTNPTAGPVWVQLEHAAGIQPPWVPAYGFRLIPAGESTFVIDLARSDSAGMVTRMRDDRVAFAAGQTRMWVVDLSARYHAAGDYRVLGIFNTRRAWKSLTVSP